MSNTTAKAIKCESCNGALDIKEEEMSVVGDIAVYIGKPERIVKCEFCEVSNLLHIGGQYSIVTGGGSAVIVSGNNIAVATGGSSASVTVGGSIVSGKITAENVVGGNLVIVNGKRINRNNWRD